VIPSPKTCFGLVLVLCCGNEKTASRAVCRFCSQGRNLSGLYSIRVDASIALRHSVSQFVSSKLFLAYCAKKQQTPLHLPPSLQKIASLHQVGVDMALVALPIRSVVT
jgi:hypothetical protein